MEIVIENPGSSLINPHLQHRAYAPPETGAFYYATLPRNHRLSGGDPDPTTTTTSVRRVDKSGLLEIPEPARLRPRHSTGTETLSRRVDRSGLLEVVPEVPDQCHRSVETITERQQHLLGAETGQLTRRRSFIDSHSTTEDSHRSPQKSSPQRNTKVQFAGDGENRRGKPPLASDSEDVPVQKEEKKKGIDCLGKLSPRLKSEKQTMSAIPDVIEAHHGAPGGNTPEGERAEAEGCERSATDGVEESRVAFKGQNKIHNDNIQAVHVIILSEQL